MNLVRNLKSNVANFRIFNSLFLLYRSGFKMHVPNGDEQKDKEKEHLVAAKVQMKTVAFQLLVDPILAHQGFQDPKMEILEELHLLHLIARVL